MSGWRLAAAVALLALLASSAGPGEYLGSAFLWAPAAPSNTYVAFTGSVRAPANASALSLCLFADSRYVLWLAGAYLARGPVRFDPTAPSYDCFDVSGRGAALPVSVLVHSYSTCDPFQWQAPEQMQEVCFNQWLGVTPSGRMQNHLPGLALALVGGDGAVLDGTGAGGSAAWQSFNATRYGATAGNWGSVMDAVDARRDDFSWRSGVAAPLGTPGWAPAVAVPSTWGALTPRPIPHLLETDVPLLPLAPSGAPAAWPITLQPGQSLLIDAGVGVQAVLHARVSSATPGATLQLRFCERLVNGSAQIFWAVNNYTLAGTAAEEELLASDSWGFRVINVTCAGPGAVTLLSANATSRLYPYAPVAAFSAPEEPFLARYFAASLATLRLVSEDAFVDCAGRERSEWVGDAVYSTAESARVFFATVTDAGGVPLPPGARIFADYRLLAQVLVHAVQSARIRYPNLMQMKAHTVSDRFDFNGIIEDYSLGVVSAFRTLYEGTGVLPPGVWPDLRALLAGFAARVRVASGLLLGREFMGVGNPVIYAVIEGTTLNAAYFRALTDGAVLAAAVGESADAAAWAAAADALRGAMLARLVDPATGALAAGLAANGSRLAPTQVANFVAVASGVFGAPGESSPALLASVRWMLASSPIDALGSPYQAVWQLRALFDYASAAVPAAEAAAVDALAIAIVVARFPDVLTPDSATTSEMFGGGDALHDMGAAAALFLPTRVLGVRAATLPAPALLVEPHLGALTAATGAAATPFGVARAAWALVNAPAGWAAGSPRAVRADVGLLVEDAPTAGATAASAASLAVTVALPLADPDCPPPAAPSALLALLLAVGDASPVNVSSVLAAGGALPADGARLTLDASGRYLRYVTAMSALRGASYNVTLRLTAAASG